MNRPDGARRVLLLAQVAPPIHGQAMMAAELARQATGWQEIHMSVINAVYATERADLGGFSLLKTLRWLRYLAQVAWQCVCGRVELVVMTHSFFRGPFIKDAAFVWLAKGLLRRKLLVWVHMDPSRLGFAALTGMFKSFAARTLRLPDRWVAVSPSLADTWPEEFPRRSRTAVCNGIPDPTGGVTATPGRARRVVFLSSMTAEKGWRELFRVAERMAAEDAALQCDFFGSPGAGETDASLAEWFGRGRFPDRVAWHGAAWGEQKAAALRGADVFCLPTWTEAFPLAVLEAMAFGLPVIVSAVGAVADAVADGGGGWLIPPRDEAALERALGAALADPTRLAAMGGANRTRFLQQFEAGAFGAAWKHLIESELASR